MDILLYILISLSFSVMWSMSDIFMPIRNIIAKLKYIRKPLLCPECSSFWIGVFVCLFVYTPTIVVVPFLNVALCALLVHFFAVILYKKII
jgi:hypothetical protein